MAYSLRSLTFDQAFFFLEEHEEKQRETRRLVGGQSGFSQSDPFSSPPTLALQYFRVPPKK